MIPYFPASPAPCGPFPEISSDVDVEEIRAFADAVARSIQRASPEERRCAEVARELVASLRTVVEAMEAYQHVVRQAEALAYIERRCRGNRRRQMRRRNQRA